MSRRVEVHPDFLDRAPREWAGWSILAGPAVALSRSSSTQLVVTGGLSLHLKRYLYSASIAFRAALRHTFLRESRAAREFRMLQSFRSRAEAAPPAVAFGERRVGGFLREAFVASETVAGATPLSEAGILPEGAVRDLARLLSRVHGSGLLHGRLFARNVLRKAAGGFLLVDLAHARCGVPNRLAPITRRARDLAFLEESLAAAGPDEGHPLLGVYLDGTGETHREREWTPILDRFRAEARERLRRRRRGDR